MPLVAWRVYLFVRNGEVRGEGGCNTASLLMSMYILLTHDLELFAVRHRLIVAHLVPLSVQGASQQHNYQAVYIHRIGNFSS